MEVSRRKKQPEVSRLAILQAAGEGFALHGYAGTGIGWIAERAGLTKGAIFHHFEDKRVLAVEWVRGELGRGLEEGVGRFAGLGSFSEWKQAGLGLLRELDGNHPIACLTLLGSEMSHDEVLSAEIAQVAQVWRDGLARGLEDGQAGGWIHRSIRPADEAVLLASLYCGLSMLVRVGGVAEVLRSAESALGAYLDTLRGEG
jgi:AcrR family transcriptional regulator